MPGGGLWQRLKVIAARVPSELCRELVRAAEGYRATKGQLTSAYHYGESCILALRRRAVAGAGLCLRETLTAT